MSQGNFANVAAGAMVDNRYLAWVLHHADNSRFIYFSSDYGATWYRPPDLGVNADRIRYSDAWGGVNGYSYHSSLFIWWRNESVLGDPDVFVTDDAGLSAYSIQGEGATNIFTATGQATDAGSAPNVISVMADISEMGWLFGQGRSVGLDLESCTARAIEKGGHEVILDYSHNTARLLRRWLRVRGNPPHEYVFTSRQGCRITKSTLWRLLRRLTDRAGVENAHPHKWRHTVGRRFAEAGAPLTVIQSKLNHRTTTVTMRYLNHGWGDRRRFTEKLAK